MKIKHAKELFEYDLDSLSRKFGFQKTELDELEKLKIIRKSDSDGNKYKFDYVRIVVLEKSFCFVYPKYMAKSNIQKEKEIGNNYKKFKLILKTIDKFNSFNLTGEQIEDENKNHFNLLQITLNLLDYFNDYGLYYSGQTILENNGEGLILWEQTISQNIAYISQQKPIYLDLITTNEVINENHIIRQIHACVLTYCCHQFSDLLDILDREKVILTTEDIDDLGSTEYLRHIIQNELRNQFVSWKHNVLILLLNFLDQYENINEQKTLNFFGTSNFQNVWENVCKRVLDNDLNKTLKELNLKHNTTESNTMILKEIISKPKWNHHQVEQTLRPDIVLIKNKKIEIYDAKYYDIELNENGLKNNPGVPDLVKQHFYGFAFEKLMENNQLELSKNGFLFPWDPIETNEAQIREKIIGQVEWSIFPSLKIEIKLMNANFLYEKYLKD